ncbi:MAG: glycosyltransferase [Chitinophagales bacterium]
MSEFQTVNPSKKTVKRLVFTVVNDLNYDQRMQRICGSLAEAGYDVTLIGRAMNNSKPLKNRVFSQVRMKLLFQRGKLFYLEYNLRLLWHFLWNRYDVFGACDLDTVMPHFLAGKLKGKPMVYDAHEYFPELPEVVHRPFTRWVWKTVEKIVVPRTKYAYTINQSYADFFKKEYGTDFQIIRNAAVLRKEDMDLNGSKVYDKQIFEEEYILYQGAVNMGRGVEEMIQAMPFIEGCKLYVCGKGDVFEDCINLVKQLDLQNKVKFFGFVPPELLRHFTLNAKLGFTFFTNDGMSYYYSLANRFFDYFHGGVPQLCVNFPEYRRINEQFEVAVLLENLKAETIAEATNQLLQNQDLYQKLQENCLAAREHINWQAEEKKLLGFYSAIK